MRGWAMSSRCDQQHRASHQHIVPPSHLREPKLRPALPPPPPPGWPSCITVCHRCIYCVPPSCRHPLTWLQRAALLPLLRRVRQHGVDQQRQVGADVECRGGGGPCRIQPRLQNSGRKADSTSCSMLVHPTAD